MMKLILAVIATLALATTGVLSTLGLDISSPLSVGALQCAKEKGYSFVVQRGYDSYGAVDPNIGTMLSNCRAAGMSCSVYLFPCRGKSPSTIASELARAPGMNKDVMVWLDLEHNPSPGCDWRQSSQQDNCVWLGQLISAAQAHFARVGVYTSEAEHTPIFGSGCRAGSDLNLWWPRYDNVPSFGGFSPFGGWNSPSIKQYYDRADMGCGIGGSADVNWYPGGPSPPSPPGPAPPSPSGGCQVFYYGLCAGPDSCMCTLGESCGNNDKNCKGNITRARTPSGGCGGSCRTVTHDECRGSDSCLKTGGLC